MLGLLHLESFVSNELPRKESMTEAEGSSLVSSGAMAKTSRLSLPLFSLLGERDTHVYFSRIVIWKRLCTQ